MASTDQSTEPTGQTPSTLGVDMKLEVVTLPVSDVDRAKDFYQSLGWRLDADFARWRRHPGGPADATALGVLDLIREGPHDSRARLRSAYGTRRLRHRGGA